MKIGVFVPLDNLEHAAVLTAFYEGLEHSGEDVFMSNIDNYIDCDVAVVFGYIKDTVKAAIHRSALIRKHQYQNKRQLLVIEKGFVHRDLYYSVGWNDFNGRADFRNKKSSSDRWNQLDTRLMRWRGYERHLNILVIGQVPHDASVQHIDFFKWARSIVNRVNCVSDKKVVWRPHPLAKMLTPNIKGAVTSDKTLTEDLAEADSVITFNSNVGVDAVIAGIPTLSCDFRSMAWDVTGHTLEDLVDRTENENREQWAFDLAYTQWTVDEMRLGQAWQHIAIKSGI